MIIGIDLGTTNSLVAYLADEGPQLIPNSLGEVLTPSVVGIDAEGKLLVGRAAKELQVVQPDCCASLFKRHMGSDWTVKLGGKKFTPEQLSSLVLKSLRDDAVAFFDKPIERAVITVPAYFNEHQRKATLDAGRMAGLTVERIFNEPTAAAIAYGLHESQEEKLIVVLDLGGGTFDVSIVELFEGVLEVRASSGETWLGGEDFTQCLAARVLGAHGFPLERTEMEAPKLVSRMLQQCEVAKCRLTRQDRITVRLPERDGSFKSDAAEIAVTRQEFDAWTQHILARVELPIRRALGDTNLKPADVNEVILVGGATRMPSFVDRVTEMLGQSPRCRLNPDEVVALGAAVQAGLIGRQQSVEDLVVTDVSPFTLGIETTREFGSELRGGYFMPIINRNTTIPVSRVERVGTVRPNQTEVRVRIFQGESRRVADNLALGEFEVHGIPRGPVGQQVDIRFTYDLNGVLEVEATVVETKQKFSHVIARYARGLSVGQIAQAVAEMQSLKTHPREEMANRYLIRRAERVYQELPLDERRRLDVLLQGFEEALELGDAEAIERHRVDVLGFLNQHDPGVGDEWRGDGDEH